MDCNYGVQACPDYTGVGEDVLGVGESLSRIKSNGKRAQQPAYRGRNRFTVWGSRVSGHWGTLVDYSVPRVVITVSPARVASSNMGKGSPHDEGST